MGRAVKDKKDLTVTILLSDLLYMNRKVRWMIGKMNISRAERHLERTIWERDFERIMREKNG
jgi:hypothetical protein